MNQSENFYEKNAVAIQKEMKRLYPIYKTILDTQGESALIEYVYGYIDGIVHQSGLKDKTPSCATGCSWCCHDAIYMSKMEQNYIRRRVKEHKVKPDKKRSKLQNSSNDHQFLDLKFADRACPFLSSTDGRGKCTIYGIRPNVCRLHNSANESIKCNKEIYPDSVIQEYRIIEGEAAAMALMLFEENNENVGLNPIHKIF